jgi:predicted transcriptional regulator
VTADERQRVQFFLARFNRIDAELRRKLKLPRAKTFKQVVDTFEQAHPGAVDTDLLRTLAAIRNALVHESLSQSDFCVIPTRTILQRLDHLHDQLVAPLRVIPTFRRTVETIAAHDTLLTVLQLIARRDYSQFPVYKTHRFIGLLTENGITRWLATGISRKSMSDLDIVTVSQLLTQEESGDTCAFIAAAEEVRTVRAMFANQPLLEAVLITDNGLCIRH